jgi:GMP synthase-like glutamine amidotransferase
VSARLWVIDPSVIRPENQGVAEILRDWPGESRLFRPALRPGDGPEPGSGYKTDGVVLMGSALSVHDSRPWIAQLSAWLRPILSGECLIPLLGICFGHQLIAHLSGGEVLFLRDDRVKRTGVEYSQLAGGRLLPGTRSLRVAVSHCEKVNSVPAGYRVVATRPGVEIDGLEHERLPIFSFQFHPEAGLEFVQHAGIDPSLLDQELKDHTQLLLGAFRDGVRSSLDAGDAWPSDQ